MAAADLWWHGDRVAWHWLVSADDRRDNRDNRDHHRLHAARGWADVVGTAATAGTAASERTDDRAAATAAGLSLDAQWTRHTRRVHCCGR